MAFVSEVCYKETRNADGSIFSQQMSATIVLKEGELPYPLNEQDQADTVVLRQGGLLVEFVRTNMDTPFKRADEKEKASGQSVRVCGLHKLPIPCKACWDAAGESKEQLGGSAQSSAQPTKEQAKPPEEKPKEEPKGKLNSKPASEAFDRNKPGWVYCPNCGSDKIHFGGKDGKKAYCACFDCQIFLNIDDRSQPKITEMKR